MPPDDEEDPLLRSLRGAASAWATATGQFEALQQALDQVRSQEEGLVEALQQAGPVAPAQQALLDERAQGMELARSMVASMVVSMEATMDYGAVGRRDFHVDPLPPADWSTEVDTPDPPPKEPQWEGYRPTMWEHLGVR